MEDEHQNFKLTQVVAQENKENKGNEEPSSCPFCDSENMEYGMAEYLYGGVYAPVRCEDCGERWEQVYGFEKIVF